MKTRQNGRYTLALTSDITCIVHIHVPPKIRHYLPSAAEYPDQVTLWQRQTKNHYTSPILKRWRWLDDNVWRLGQGSAINRIPILHFAIAKNTEAHKRTGRPILAYR